MKKLLQVLAFGGLIGLGLYHFINNKQAPVVDPQLVEYTDQWRADMDAAGIKYDWNRLDYIKVDKSMGQAGHCDQLKRTVTIRIADHYQPIHVKVIVYHELAHYFFQVEHTKRGDIMASQLEDDAEYYRGNWDDLLENYINYIKEEP